MYIKVYDLSLTQNSTPIFSNLSFFIRKNESVRVVGKNAIQTKCLLEVLAGKRRQTSGTVTMGETGDLKFKGIAYLPSDSHLLAHHTVLENLTIPLILKGFDRSDAEELANENLKIFKLERFKDFYPCQLNTSILKQVAFAEICLFDADILILDNPFCHIKNEDRTSLYRQINQKRLDGVTIILACDNDFEAEFLTERSIFVESLCGIC